MYHSDLIPGDLIRRKKGPVWHWGVWLPRDSSCKFPLLLQLFSKRLFRTTFFVIFVGITQGQGVVHNTSRCRA